MISRKEAQRLECNGARGVVVCAPIGIAVYLVIAVVIVLAVTL